MRGIYIKRGSASKFKYLRYTFLMRHLRGRWADFFLLSFLCLLLIPAAPAHARSRRHRHHRRHRRFSRRLHSETRDIPSILGGSPKNLSNGKPPAPLDRIVDIDHIDGRTLYFHAPNGIPTPKPLPLNLFDPRHLGTLRPADGGQPYYILSGRTCENCLEDTGIFIVQATGGKPYSYGYPGKIFENKGHALAIASRAFYGHCLADRSGDELVMYQAEKVDRRRGYLTSVLVAAPETDERLVDGRGLSTPAKVPDHLHEWLIERRLPRIRATLALVRSGSCTEIAGRNRVMASRPLDVDLRHQKLNDNDDEDSDEEAAPLEGATAVDEDGTAPTGAGQNKGPPQGNQPK